MRSAQVRMGSARDLVRAASGCAVSVCIQIFDSILRIQYHKVIAPVLRSFILHMGSKTRTQRSCVVLLICDDLEIVFHKVL